MCEMVVRYVSGVEAAGATECMMLGLLSCSQVVWWEIFAALGGKMCEMMSMCIGG